MAKSTRSEGEVLDRRYRLMKRLGRGGFGDVWQAEELLPDGTTLRQVALKLLHGSLSSAPDWSAEARIIASLRHPALVTVYAAGVLSADRSIPFVAMELLIGDNLGDIASDKRPVPWRRVLSWAREAAAALDVIHMAGVVHLDLKPANLFLAEGAVKVLDFGIARQGMARPAEASPADPDEAGASDDAMSTAAFMIQHVRHDAEDPSTTAPTTSSRSVVGTPGFMAPETFEGGEATPATDAYALAACIVQLVTGRLPQEVSDKTPTEDPSTTVGAWFAEVQAATVRGQIRRIGDDHPELPGALVALLERWLALDPAARGVERGSLREALDAVWRCPSGFTDNPYRGLAPHRVSDEGKLFGRAPDVARIGRELVDQPGVVLYGEGAIGLSSLAMAGIVPELARHFADGKHDWLCCEVLLAQANDEVSPDAVLERSLSAFLAARGVTDDRSLLDWAETAQVGTVVFIDDLERLAGLENPDDDAETAAANGGYSEILALLASVAAGRAGVRVVATLNADHVAALAERDGLGPILRPWLRFIGPLQASSVAELLHGPLFGVGKNVDGVERIIADLQDELAHDGTRLSLISLALESWWDTSELDAQSWKSGGALLGRLCAHAERVFDELEPADRAVADNVLLRTLSVDGTSAPVAELALLEASEDKPRLRRVIDTLVSKRLVMRDKGHLRLAHIGLAKAWPRLNDLRLHDIDRLSFLEDLRNAARRWALAGRIRKHVWPSDMLRALARRREDVVGELGATERAFVAASQRARRLRWALQGFALAACGFFAILAYFVNARIDERDRAQRDRLEDARTVAALGRMVTASRRTVDPYQRVALLSGAIREGATDPVLALELAEAGRGLFPAELISLERIARPDFPWGERWLVGATNTHLVVFDFEPPAGEAWAPLHYRFRPHAGNLTDIVPFRFDTSVLTRDQRGEVKVWRLREEGQVALAAEAPEHCVLGPVMVASESPVVACTTPTGVARWDLRAPKAMTPSKFDGRVLDVSPDGNWIIAARLRKLLIWNQATGVRTEVSLDGPPSVARVSPRDPLLLVVHGLKLDVLRLDDATRVLRRDVLVPEPMVARWAESGIDAAVCDYAGEGEWHYLRSGARAPDDPPLPTDPKPCAEARPEWPKPLHDAAAYGPIGSADVGPRVLEGGWQRKDGTLVTHDLVMFDPSDDGLARRLEVTAIAKERPASASAAAVFQDDDGVVWQVEDQIRRHDRSGAEVASWRGHLLARCPNGRLLAWRRKDHADDAAHWEIFGARVDVLLATIARTPGNVLGVDPGCHRVAFQSLDGTLSTLDVDEDEAPKPLVIEGGGFVVDGYVYDVRPSYALSSTLTPNTAPTALTPESPKTTQSPGMWLAFSSGAMVRLDGVTGAVEAFGHAMPRATAMADGARPGELVFADDRGVILRRAGVEDRVILPPLSERVWEDIALGPDGTTAWLSWAHGVTVIDLNLGDVLGELEVTAHDRLTRWDDAGSLLLWPYSYKGQPKGRVIPIGRELAAAVGAAASNIRAGLGEDKRAIIRLDD